jgi:NAD(P)-dependent dehydrogenase (short-subunit alcohol dehydrogenase family)
MKLDMNNKVVLVTGGGGAIGSATALKFAENGADVIIHDLKEELGNKVVQQIIEMGRRSAFIKADLNIPEEAKKMSEKALEIFGKIDILINNAGTNAPDGGRKPVHEFSDEDWNRIINVDLSGIYYVSKPIIKSMIVKKCGKIVNVGSVAGIVPLRLQSAYVAAKAGVHQLTRAMAVELGQYNICINAVLPGSTLSEGVRKKFYTDPAISKSFLSHIPLNRPGKPVEIANAILFLASDEASYITGSLLVVDGGWTCGFSRDF